MEIRSMLSAVKPSKELPQRLLTLVHHKHGLFRQAAHKRVSRFGEQAVALVEMMLAAQEVLVEQEHIKKFSWRTLLPVMFTLSMLVVVVEAVQTVRLILVEVPQDTTVVALVVMQGTPGHPVVVAVVEVGLELPMLVEEQQ
jgi:hypothetical protein